MCCTAIGSSAVSRPASAVTNTNTRGKSSYEGDVRDDEEGEVSSSGDKDLEDVGASDKRGIRSGVSSSSAQPPLRPISTTRSSIRVNSSFLRKE